MEAWRDYLLREGTSNVIYIDLTDLDFESLLDYHALYAHVRSRTDEARPNILLIDEVQECRGFERVINSLVSSGRYDIYLTGSNAFLLSSDLATLFTGRQMQIPVFPFGFSEYIQYAGAGDVQRLFDRYLVEGGLAGSYLYPKATDRTQYVKEVFETILTRDLVQKFDLKEPVLLRHLAEYLMDNVANLTNPHRTSLALVQNKVTTNHVTASAYMNYLVQAFLFYPVKRYDIRGKRYLETSEKFYLSDLGFRYAELGSRNMDYGHAYENLVLLELLRRGYEVYIGKLYEKEVDFVAMRGSEKIYIQVSDDVSNTTTLAREVDPLLKIRDAYPKMLIARTRNPTYDLDGILVCDLAAWLAGDVGESRQVDSRTSLAAPAEA